MAHYKLDEFTDKLIYSRKDGAKIHSLPDDNSPVLSTRNKGQTLGKVYSWLYGLPNGVEDKSQYWFMMYEKYGPNQKRGYVKVNSQIDGKYFEEEGIKTVTQRKEEEANKNLSSWEKALLEADKRLKAAAAKAAKGLKTAGIIATVAFVGYKIATKKIEESEKTKREKNRRYGM